MNIYFETVNVNHLFYSFNNTPMEFDKPTLKIILLGKRIFNKEV